MKRFGLKAGPVNAKKWWDKRHLLYVATGLVGLILLTGATMLVFNHFKKKTNKSTDVIDVLSGYKKDFFKDSAATNASLAQDLSKKDPTTMTNAQDKADYYFQKSNLLTEPKDYGQAESYLKQAIEQIPGNDGYWMALARIQATQGHKSDAVTSYEKVISLLKSSGSGASYISLIQSERDKL